MATPPPPESGATARAIAAPQAGTSSTDQLAATNTSHPLLPDSHHDPQDHGPTPSKMQMWAMFRVRTFLYQRNLKLALTGILFPLAMIGIAIGMSALLMSTIGNRMPQPGTNLPAIPLLAPVAASGSVEDLLATGGSDRKPLVLVAGGSDDAAIRTIQSIMDRYFVATQQRASWLRVQSAQQLNDLQLDRARKRSSGGGQDDNRNPVGGFFLHQTPSTSQPLNMSLVVNADAGEGPSLQRVAPHVLTILNPAIQAIVPVSGPSSDHFAKAGQDPRTAPTQGPVGPSGPAAAQLIGQVFAQYGAASQAPGAALLPPWQVGFNGSLSTFRAQAADRFDLSVSLVPPFVTYGLYFMTAFLTEQLVRERADGQFDYFVVNTLSPTAYYTSFFLISALFLLLPCAAASVGMGIWVIWFRESNWLGIVLLFLAFSATTVTGAGFFSFFFRSKQAVGPVLGFGSAIVTFLPYFVFEFGVKTEVGLGTVCAITAFLPSFGLYRALALVAQAHIAGKPMTGFSFAEPILPVLLILLAQAVVGYALTIYLANATTTGEATGSAPIASLFARTAPAAESSNVDEEAHPPGEHPNAAIPLDPYLLSEKRRIQEGRQGERQDVVAVKGLCMDFMTVEKRGEGVFAREKTARLRVLDDLYLSLFKNESLAFLGPNGAGKSTAISILIGLLKPTRGNATIDGKSVVPFDPSIKRILGVCPQHDKTFPDLTVREHLEAFAAIKGLADVEQAVVTALKDMALKEVEHKRSKELSGGNRRRLSIAVACLGRPRVVILDEPTTGVDVATRRTIWKSITELKKHSSLILVTHAMDEADALCERIGIMVNGSLVCLGTPQRLKSLYGAAYKVTLRFHSADQVSPALAGLHAQFPRGSVKVLNQTSGGPNLDVEIDMAKLAAAYTGSTDVLAQQHEPQRLPDGRVVLVESAAIDRSRVTARFLGDMFRLVADKRDKWGITDWSVGEVTLSEVFVRLAKYHRSHVEEEEKRKEAVPS